MQWGKKMTEDEAWDELERKQNKKDKQPEIDWEAVAADQALTIAMLQGDIEHSLARVANALDIADRAYFAGKKDGIDETIALIREKNK
jgi:hypothetical protein